MARPTHHHEMNFIGTDEVHQQATFQCEHCQRKIGFWKPNDEGHMPVAIDNGDGTYSLSDEHHAPSGAVMVTLGKCDT